MSVPSSHTPSYRDCYTCPVRQITPLRHLSEEEINLLFEKHKCSSLPGQRVIFFEGDPPRAVYIVNEGLVKLSKIFKDGKEQIIRIVYPGQILGYRSVILQKPYSATAITLKPTHLCTIPAELFLHYLQQNPKIAYEIMQQACEDIGALQHRVAQMGYKNVVEKVAEALIFLSQHTGRNEYEVEIRREDLAQFMGIARETVSRVISEFKLERLIDVRGKRIILLNKDKLYHLAHLYD